MESGTSQQALVARPPDQLHDLPVGFRWEATRRHPYYLIFWRDALHYRRGDIGDNPDQQLLRYAAMLYLGAIGVCGEPVNPETSFDELDLDGLDPAFLSGAVQPLTLRAVVAMLINALPPAERALVGALLTTSGNAEYRVKGDDELCTVQKQTAITELMKYRSTALDSYPDAPLFYIHMGASQRTTAQDVAAQVRRWKQRRGIDEKRVHTKKLASYLESWDLREGWTGKGYDSSQEKTFDEVARLQKKPLSTVVNRYRAAFQMVTGHQFSARLWIRLFGILRLGEPSASFAKRVKIQLGFDSETSSPVMVPDSVVSSQSNESHGMGVVESGSAVESQTDYQDLVIDLQELFEKGLSDREIADRMEIPDLEIIADFRRRLDEFGELL